MRRFLPILILLVVTGGLLVRFAPVSLPAPEPASAATVVPESEGCTIGVAHGSVTADGRPLLWKARDSAYRNNHVFYNTESIYNFISIRNSNLIDDLRAWMGVNECGFAVVNSTIHRPVSPAGKDTIISNGEFMRGALGTCSSVADFAVFVDTTSSARFLRGNFGVIDTTGAAFVYEIVDSLHWAFDSATTEVGYLIRTNFACNDSAEGTIGKADGYERFLRSHDLIDQFIAESSLTPSSIMQGHMRDFSDSNSCAVPVPFPNSWEPGRPWGFINTEWSICRHITVSSVVIQGVDPGAVPTEPAFLSTMWTMLGNSASAITVPYWPVGEAPPAACGQYNAPLCDASLDLKAYLFWYSGGSGYIDSYRMRDGNGGGLWATTLATEDSIFTQAGEWLSRWRLVSPPWGSMLAVENDLAEQALATLSLYHAVPIADPPVRPPASYLQAVYPNPFNPGTTIEYHLPRAAHVSLAVYDVSGRRVARLLDQTLAAGQHQTRWDAGTLPSGSYLVQLRVGDKTFSQRCLLVK